MKKINSILIFLLSAILTFSSCKSLGNSVSSETQALKRDAPIETTISQTTTTALPETTTTTATTTVTTPATTLPEAVTIATTARPVISEVPAATAAVSQMTAPAVTAPLAAAATAPLVTTAVPVTTSPSLQQKLTPITSSYVYNNLSADKKIVYNKILSAAKSCTSVVNFDEPVSIETVTDIYSIIFSEEINLQYLSDSFKYDKNPVSKLQISYTYSADTVNTMNAQTEAKANEIISQITPTMTTFDIVKYFHNTIIKNCTYDDTAEFSSTAYGALVKGRALCQGYSHAMSLLCSKVGIENALITGYAKEEHMWNSVRLNGNWYNIDVTWDDQSAAERPDFYVYDYFNVTDADLSTRQFYAGYVPLPVSTANTDNYFVHNGLVANSLAEAQQILYNEYICAANAGERYVRIKCANAQVYNEVFNALYTQQGIFSIQTQANTQATNKFNPKTVSLVKNDEMYVLNFFVNY